MKTHVTQTSSDMRVKKDLLGPEALKTLYAKYTLLNDEQFINYCKEMIQSGTGSQSKKDLFKSKIDSIKIRSRVLKLTQDFVLAGLGLGV